jgi:hypothetical protein
LESAFGGVAGADDFAFMGDIDKRIGDRAGGAAEGGVAGADDPDAFKQAHGAVHLEAVLGDGVGGDALEGVDVVGRDVGRELAGGLVAPADGDFFA